VTGVPVLPARRQFKASRNGRVSVSSGLRDYRNDAYWQDPFTLGHFIFVLRDYGELQSQNASYRHPSGGITAVRAGSAEAIARLNNCRDLMRVSNILTHAPGKGRFQLLCDELENDHGLTATNVIKLRAKICRIKSCTIEEANALTLDNAADILENTNGATNDKGKKTRHSVNSNSSDVNSSGILPDVEGKIRALGIYTGEISDARFREIPLVAHDTTLTANEKLYKIDALVTIPANTSAKILGKALDVTKEAIVKTDWWKKKRKGKKQDVISQRHNVLRERGREHDRR
jgi:hypothetical protein